MHVSSYAKKVWVMNTSGEVLRASRAHKTCMYFTRKVLVNIDPVIQICNFLNTDLGFCSAENIPLKVSKWCVTHSGTPPTFPWLEKGKGVLKITLRILSKWPEEKKEQGEGIIKMINESWVCCYYRLCCFFSREGMYHFLLEKLESATEHLQF